MSLSFVIRELETTKYEPVVVLLFPSEKLRDLFSDAGAEVVELKGYRTFEHTTARKYEIWNLRDVKDLVLSVLYGLMFSTQLRRHISKLKPDIIHLNSVVLIWFAFALRKFKTPVIWHVREYPVKGLLGIRRLWIRTALKKFPDKIIFLNQTARHAWMGSEELGEVIYNFVDLNKFDFNLKSDDLKHELGLENRYPIILYVGGIMEIKGVFVLLKAISFLKRGYPNLCCLMPGSEIIRKNDPFRYLVKKTLNLFGYRSISDRFLNTLNSNDLRQYCVNLAYDINMAPYYSVSDLVVFPALEPHFSRPIMEAGAMKKPVIASNLPGVGEQVVDNVNGKLVIPGNAEDLSKVLSDMLQRRSMMQAMGEAGYQLCVNRYTSKIQMSNFDRIYNEVIEGA